jgi:hypothetical protein
MVMHAMMRSSVFGRWSVQTQLTTFRALPQAGQMIRSCASIGLTVLAGTILYGCASTPPDLLRMPSTTLSVVGKPAAVDERARYRRFFCEALSRSADPIGDATCDEFLWRLPDEPDEDRSPPPIAVLKTPALVMVVGGAFGDCFPPASTPFADDVRRLREQGFDIEYVSVSGRSSTELNSGTIAARIAAIPFPDRRPLILIGYSKGMADILESLAGHPDITKRVSAVVSIAGAINGSPLARRYAHLYGWLFAKVALGSCPASDAGVVRSLERSRRLNWLAEHQLPANIHYYSLGTFTAPGRLARALGPTYRQLSQIDPRNDGQLLTQDEVIPGSALLGYANADHWAVALRVEDRFPFLAHRTEWQHPFPQDALLDSILRLVRADLDASSTRSRSQAGSTEESDASQAQEQGVEYP